MSSHSPPDIFIWRKDDVRLMRPSGSTPIIHTNTSAEFSTNYTISNLSISDVGAYTCTVRNPIGSDSSSNINVSVGK